MSTQGLLDSYDASLREGAETPALASTGLESLDALVGGLRAGQVWLVVGGSGQGRTTLLVQWALQVARGGHRVALACPREPASWLAARMLAQTLRLPLSRVATGNVPGDRLQRAREQLAGLPLSTYPRDGRGFVPETDAHREGAEAAAVVVDDADLVGGMTPTRVQEYAEAGILVVVSLPRHQVLLGPDDEAPLEPAWTRVSDVVLEVRHRGLPPLPSSTGDADRPTPRPGEADLLVHRHRRGPTLNLAASFQGHLSRFVEWAG